ncbi:MAG: multidrug efflux MFS transporter [bacterium]|nr:multidrug efflux MFS transporter [bacterium]
MADWRRTYWVVWLANLVTSIGMMSFLPFFPSLLEEMGVEDRASVAAWSGVIFGAAPLSATVMSPIWGAVGDRVGRKLMICRAMIAIAIFVGGMGLATTPLQLLLMRIGQGLFSGFIPPSITLVSVGAPADRQGRVAGDLTTALALGGMFGPLLGGFIANWSGGHTTVFGFVAVGALTSAALVALFAVEDPGTRKQGAGKSVRSVLRGMRSDLSNVLGMPRVRSTIGLIFFLQLGLASANPILELYVRELLAHGELGGAWRVMARWLPGLSIDDRASVVTFATSLLFGGMAIANLLSLPLWGRYGDRVGHGKALMLCAAGSVLALGLQASAPIYFVLLAGRVVFGAAMAGTGPLAFGLAAAEVAVERRGGAMGIMFSARTFAVAVGGAVGGVLSSWIGVRGLMAASAAAVLGALILFRRAER